MKTLKRTTNLVKKGYEGLGNYLSPSNFTYMWSLCSIALNYLIIQMFSGLFLSMYYKADLSMAFTSVEYINRELYYGRYVHMNGASIFFLLKIFFFYKVERLRKLVSSYFLILVHNKTIKFFYELQFNLFLISNFDISDICLYTGDAAAPVAAAVGIAAKIGATVVGTLSWSVIGALVVCAGVVGAVGVGYNQYSKAAKEQVVEEATDLLNDLDSTFPDFAKTTTEEAVNKELLMDQLLFFSNEVPIDKVIELQQHLHPGHLACLSIFFGTIFCWNTLSTGIFTDYVVFELERFFNKEVFKILGDALSKSSRIKIEEEIHYIFESLVRKFQLEQVLYNYNGYTLREVSLRKSFIIDLKDVASLVGEYMLGSLKHGVWLKDHLEVWMPHALDTITNKSQEFKVAHDLLVNGELEHLRSLFKDDASKLDQFNRIASEAILKTDDSIGILRSKTMDTAENFFRVLNAELFKSASNPKVNLIEARSQINAFHKLFLDNSSSWVAREYVAVNNETKNLVSYLAQIASDIYHKD